MPDIFTILASLLMGIQGVVNPSANLLPKAPITTTQPVQICLNEKLAKTGIDPGLTKVPKILKNIKKPDRINTNSGYEIPECLNNGACDGPETANYRLIATNIKLEYTVFPNSFVEGEKLSDRQLVKQTDITSDPILKDRYKNRIYRTFCGDWCSTCKPADVICFDSECLTGTCDTKNPPVTLPFMGSFHCDFIFYLQTTDSEGKIQVDENGNIPTSMLSRDDPTIPKNNSLYSVYFRSGASLPPEISCENSIDAIDNSPEIDTSPIGPLVEYPKDSQIYWHLSKNPNSPNGSFTARNSEIINYQVQVTLTDPAGLTGAYDLVKNLVDPDSNELMYLVTQNTLATQMEGLKSNPPNITLFKYFQLERWNQKAGQKSLKLGTFPFKMDWVKDWVKESKPAIYIYPQKTSSVNVKLAPKGYLTVSDPPYNPIFGWNIIANPDGTIIQLPTTNYQLPTIYSYLYYEANLSEKPDPKEGFVIGKNELQNFFDETLPATGLNDKEIMDFKEYWLSRLTKLDTGYFLIYFLSKDEIERIEPVSISLPIQTSIRIRTYFKPIKDMISLPIQNLPPAPKRTGNIMVEWGGILDE